MNAVLPDMITTQECCGFTTKPFADNPRLQVVTLQADVMQRFAEGSEHWPLQALEYKPFLRFAIADFLDELTENSLALLLNAIMRSRDTGAFLLNYAAPVEGLDAEQATELDIKLSTAVSHLIGVPNHDAMYGKFYARFTVKNTDNSDSYLRQAHRRMELHNDGTYVDERTDFVLMQKLAEVNMEGEIPCYCMWMSGRSWKSSIITRWPNRIFSGGAKVQERQHKGSASGILRRGCAG